MAWLFAQVRETTRDVTFLHNELFYAAAQKKYAYIYDKRGMEVHCLRDHTAPSRLEFLPHHFLLASIGEPGRERSEHHVYLYGMCTSLVFVVAAAAAAAAAAMVTSGMLVRL